jgi:crotonobetainyl-CoA:carnitine CoA-transferase CaiB-like acyl-CoA transferase
MVESADVLVHNFRPSMAPRLRIDYPRLKLMNPRLVDCSVTGYGQTGPLREKAGYDQVLQAMTGMCSLQGTENEPEIVYGSVVDYYAASMVLSELALNERYATVRMGAEHAGEIVPKVRATLIARTALEWEEIFGDRVPCSATRSIEDMFDHPQVQAQDLVADFDHPLVARPVAV